MALNIVKQLVSAPHELFLFQAILHFCGILTCVFVVTKQGQNDTLKNHLHFPDFIQ